MINSTGIRNISLQPEEAGLFCECFDERSDHNKEDCSEPVKYILVFQ
jgi:hypothetical protein